jgi:hypothetical protein
MTKKDHKKYGPLPPKIAESDTIFLIHSLCGSDESINNKDTSQITLSDSLPALKMIDPATGWFEIVEVTNKSATSIQDFFIKSGWHVTRDLNLLSLKMGWI